MNQEAYRMAFNEANAELIDIMSKFEKLRLQKERVETVVAALKPMVDMQAQTMAG
jgi:hypothetical protein